MNPSTWGLCEPTAGGRPGGEAPGMRYVMRWRIDMTSAHHLESSYVSTKLHLQLVWTCLNLDSEKSEPSGCQEFDTRMCYKYDDL